MYQSQTLYLTPPIVLLWLKQDHDSLTCQPQLSGAVKYGKFECGNHR